VALLAPTDDFRDAARQATYCVDRFAVWTHAGWQLFQPDGFEDEQGLLDVVEHSAELTVCLRKAENDVGARGATHSMNSSVAHVHPPASSTHPTVEHLVAPRHGLTTHLREPGRQWLDDRGGLR
jgi:hypothetical protein